MRFIQSAAFTTTSFLWDPSVMIMLFDDFHYFCSQSFCFIWCLIHHGLPFNVILWGSEWRWLFFNVRKNIKCTLACLLCPRTWSKSIMSYKQETMLVATGRERLQVTYVTMVPWGNETLRHHALGTPCAWPALNLLCNLTNGRARRHRWVTSETRKHKSTCGKAGDSLKSWRTALARMPEVWQRDAASRSLKEPWLHT